MQLYERSHTRHSNTSAEFDSTILRNHDYSVWSKIFFAYFVFLYFMSIFLSYNIGPSVLFLALHLFCFLEVFFSSQPQEIRSLVYALAMKRGTCTCISLENETLVSKVLSVKRMTDSGHPSIDNARIAQQKDATGIRVGRQ